MVNPSYKSSETSGAWQWQLQGAWGTFAAAAFLVSVPVFIEAPLVRHYPVLSVVSTLLWICLGLILIQRPHSQIWGDLLLGFSWSWLAGAIYWGWFRWEPAIHLPIESIGVPFALWALWKGVSKIGSLFYLGSLLGTAITDLYFYQVGLIDYWRQLMEVEPTLAMPILQQAIAQVRTPWGTAWAVVLVNLLLGVGIMSLGTKQLHWYAFSGAVLTTIVVDSLFLWFASCA
ncbi:DUF3120 domain-containing protein [Chamaesiphon sp. VAR_48_metabat_135_sub]|uniref:DUF3120 domain-containing protein n=1 Tax=Chamaesiphon sp. VAR_48_metabat_135_sub TaxID=2964699 RepID=UPI00286C0436|nr:DUF3120 domain-containing protein [Chamaesiphon sp. VAR_48_metabat_135_sub]